MDLKKVVYICLQELTHAQEAVLSICFNFAITPRKILKEQIFSSAEVAVDRPLKEAEELRHLLGTDNDNATVGMDMVEYTVQKWNTFFKIKFINKSHKTSKTTWKKPPRIK